MLMNYAWIGLAGGAIAFVHCLGMCGGFALHLSRAGGALSVLRRHLFWHAGKAATYVFLGALAGFGGATVQSFARAAWAQNALSWAAGVVMILMGLALMGLLPAAVRRRRTWQTDGLYASLLRAFLEEPTAAGALGLGLATGFLPCPIVLAFFAYSAHTGSVLAGMATMGGLALGTVWSLLLLGITGHWISLRLRRWGAIVAGVSAGAAGSRDGVARHGGIPSHVGLRRPGFLLLRDGAGALTCLVPHAHIAVCRSSPDRASAGARLLLLRLLPGQPHRRRPGRSRDRAPGASCA